MNKEVNECFKVPRGQPTDGARSSVRASGRKEMGFEGILDGKPVKTTMKEGKPRQTKNARVCKPRQNATHGPSGPANDLCEVCQCSDCKCKDKSRKSHSRGRKGAGLVGRAISDAVAELRGQMDAVKELRDEVAPEFVPTAPVVKNKAPSVADMPGDIYITRVKIGRDFRLLMSLFVMYLGLLIVPVTTMILSPTSLLLIFLILMYILPVGAIELRATVTPTRDEVDDRPVSDTSREVTLGKVYALDYYCVFESQSTLLSSFGLNRTIVPFTVLKAVYPSCYSLFEDWNVLGGVCRTQCRDHITSSLWNELVGRKTDSTLDPQLEMIRKSIDYTPQNKHELLAYGQSVTTTTIKVVRLQLAGVLDKPFQDQPQLRSFSMDTGSMTSMLPHPTHVLSRVIEWLRIITLVTVVVSLLLLVVGSIFLATVYLDPTQKTTSTYFQGARSASQANPPLGRDGCEEGCADLLSYSCVSCKIGDFLVQLNDILRWILNHGSGQQTTETSEKIRSASRTMVPRLIDSLILKAVIFLILVSLSNLGSLSRFLCRIFFAAILTLYWMFLAWRNAPFFVAV